MQAHNVTFREKTELLTKSNFYLIGIGGSVLFLSMWYGGIGYLFGLAAVIIMLWANRWDLSILDLQRAELFYAITKSTIYAILLFVVVDILIQPIVEKYLGSIDLSSLNGLRGNFISYVIFILTMWLFAAFGEEFFYRGFIMRRVAFMLGGGSKNWLVAAVISSFFFGIAHLYQGWILQHDRNISNIS